MTTSESTTTTTTMAAKPVSFKVGQRVAKSSPHAFDVHVDIHKKHHVDRIEFRKHGALVYRPLYTVQDPAGMHLTEHGSEIQRFYMRGYKASKDESTIAVKIFLKTGQATEVAYHVDCSKQSRVTYKNVLMKPRLAWTEKQSVPPLTPRHTFGVELELSDSQGANQAAIAYTITNLSAVRVRVVHSYHQAHKPISTWKLVSDGSLVCSRNAPDCSKFELVSPILRGEEGLEQCRDVLKALRKSTSTNISVNRSMGFHVHVSVEGFSLEEIKKICLNFVK